MAATHTLSLVIQNENFNTTAAETVPRTVTDSAGNVYLAYLTQGSVSGGSNAGQNDLVVMKLNNNCVRQWVKQVAGVMNTSSGELNPFISVDGSGNCYVAYSSNGTVSGAAGSVDAILLKFSSADGTILWSKSARPPSTTDTDSISWIDVDTNGNIYFAFDSLAAVSGQTSRARDNILVKYNTDGVMQWVRQDINLNTASNDAVMIFKVTSSSIYTAFRTQGAISGATQLGVTDVVVAKLNTSDGSIVWIKQLAQVNTTQVDSPSGIAIDANENCYISYSTSGTLSGGNATQTNRVVLFKMDKDGNVVWAKQDITYNSNGATNTNPFIVCNSSGVLFMTYIADGSISGGSNRGGNDIVLMSLDTNGNVIWARQDAAINTSLAEASPWLSIDSNQNLFLTYTSTGTVSGGTNRANTDIVIVKYKAPSAPDAPTSVRALASNGKAYITWTIPANNGGSAITSYTVTSNPGNLSVTTTPSNTGALLSGLSNGTAYTFTVTATNVLGTSDPSTASPSVTPDSLSSTQHQLEWALQTPFLNSSGNEITPRSAVDLSGNVFICYSQSLNIFVTKVNSSGQIQWTQPALNTASTESDPFVGTDGSGNCYVAYSSAGTVSGGAGTEDVVLIKLAGSTGSIMWSRSERPPSTTNTDSMRHLVVDNDGNSYFTYNTLGAVSGQVARLTDAVYCKYDTNGNRQWVRQNFNLNTGGDEGSAFLAVTSSSLYVTYVTNNTVSGGTNIGSFDIVVAKMNTSDGSIVWIKQMIQFNTTAFDSNPRITIDANENCYVIYATSGTLSGGNATQNQRNTVFKMDKDGNLLWSKQDITYNTNGITNTSPILVCNSSGVVFIAYEASGSISGGSNQGGNDIILMSLDTNGNLLWTQQNSSINTSSNDSSPWLSIDSNQNLYLSYITQGAISIGTSVGSNDIVITKYAPPPLSSGIIAGGPSSISTYIAAQPVATVSQQTSLVIDIRTGLNITTYANEAAKAAAKKAYIDSMQTALGASSFVIPAANFSSFSNTLLSRSSGLTAKPTTVIYPSFTNLDATVDVSAMSASNYVHIEIPSGYTVTLQNGEATYPLTFNGTNYSSGATLIPLNTSIVLGDKTFILVGIGSAMFNQNSGSNVVCLTEGTLIATPTGEVPIESLKRGDYVLTGEHRVVRIIKLEKTIVVNAMANNVPYIVEKDAFGTSKPSKKMRVSPRHAIQLGTDIWEIPREAAKDNKKVYTDTETLGKQVVYYHIALPDYATDTLVANGIVTECLNDGKYTESYTWDQSAHGYRRILRLLE